MNCFLLYATVHGRYFSLRLTLSQNPAETSTLPQARLKLKNLNRFVNRSSDSKNKTNLGKKFPGPQKSDLSPGEGEMLSQCPVLSREKVTRVSVFRLISDTWRRQTLLPRDVLLLAFSLALMLREGAGWRQDYV